MVMVERDDDFNKRIIADFLRKEIPVDTDGWGQWAKKVLGDIDDLKKSCQDINAKLGDISVEIAILKTQAKSAGALAGALWGALASAGVGIITAVLSYILRH